MLVLFQTLVSTFIIIMLLVVLMLIRDVLHSIKKYNEQQRQNRFKHY